MKMFTIDIESLATPENSGYNIVIPNYAVVRIPEVLTHEMEWLYVQLPIQDQLDLGLKVDARTMDFWFNACAQEFPLALCEMQKSFQLTSPVALCSDGAKLSQNIPSVLKWFLHDAAEPRFSTKIFGNGCNFDCSILQENHRVMFGDGNLWNYASPQNVRTLRMLLTKNEEAEMKEAIQPHLDLFVEDIDSMNLMYPLCLHNPLYDAAKESLMTRYMLDLKKSLDDTEA
jgi:hypothetical protein